METIKQVLMRRDNMSEMDADNLIEEAKIDFEKQLMANELDDLDFCSLWFSLEPDYILEFLEV